MENENNSSPVVRRILGVLVLGGSISLCCGRMDLVMVIGFVAFMLWTIGGLFSGSFRPLTAIVLIVVVVGMAGLITVPGLISSRGEANQSAAISHLRDLAKAQRQLQEKVVVDLNKNAIGEYGYYGELAGGFVRGAKGQLTRQQVTPPLLGATWGDVNKSGYTQFRGYCFRIFLPGRDLVGVGERTPAAANISASGAEKYWCAYAWPIQNISGSVIFFINQTGQILVCKIPSGDLGSAHMPAWDAAYAKGVSSMAGLTAMDGIGNNGVRWGGQR